MKKVIICIGDSLTEGDYGIKGKSGIVNVQPKGYPYFLEKMLDCEARNYGKCGFGPVSYLKFYKEGTVNMCGADAVVVMIGTNGNLDLDLECQGNKDYHELITLLKKDAPHAKLIICTPPHVTTNPEYSNCGYEERVDKAVRFIRDYVKREEHILLDLAASDAFRADNEHIMQPNDGLHFGEVGYETLAGIIAQELKKHI